MRALAVASPGERLAGDFVRYFPDEEDASSALGPADVAHLTGDLSAVYAAAADGVAAALTRRCGVAPSAAHALVRDPVVLITHIFLDRLLRLKRLVDRDGAAAWSAPRVPLETPVLLTSIGRAATESREFNQALLGRVAGVWRLGNAAVPPPRPEAPGSAANLNFAAPGLLRRIAWKSARLSSRAAGRIPTLGLAYAESCFLDAGLIGPLNMADLHGRAEEEAPPRDEALRRDVVLDGCAGARSALEAVLSSWGFSGDESREAIAAHAELCADLFPRARLEDLGPRLRRAEGLLGRFAGRPLLLSEMGDDRTACMIAAAKTLGMPVVGIQHGAHYGFVDAPCHIELEHAHIDRFVTWGWTRMPEHPLCARVETIPLPSPWLSERARRWRREVAAPSTAKRAWDVLLMTERIARYPATMNTVRVNRLDALDTLDSELKGVVDALAARGLSVLHKPFNGASAEAQGVAIGALRASRRGRYATHDRLDKGLSAELLSSVGLVVWDEPGGGIFECLVSGIPALLLWTTSRYARSARADGPFQALAEAGVFHSSSESVGEAAAEAAADPAAWVRNPRRAALIAAACRELAWADQGWTKHWRRFLGSL